MTPADFKIIVNGLIEDQIIYLNETDQSTDFPLCDWCFELIDALKVVGDEGMCKTCKGLGQIKREKARTIGYTLSPGEILDEHLIDCPDCSMPRESTMTGVLHETQNINRGD